MDDYPEDGATERMPANGILRGARSGGARHPRLRRAALRKCGPNRGQRMSDGRTTEEHLRSSGEGQRLDAWLRRGCPLHNLAAIGLGEDDEIREIDRAISIEIILGFVAGLSLPGAEVLGKCHEVGKAHCSVTIKVACQCRLRLLA